MFNWQEMEALIALAQRAPKSQAEALWLAQVVDKARGQVAAQQAEKSAGEPTEETDA
jgi:hypothetical protein